MDWAASSTELVMQRLNRLQNTNDVFLGDAATGAVRTVLTERDSTWVEVVNDLRWLGGGKRFIWVSERDGWRRLYAVSRDGRTVRPLTADGIDLANPETAFGEPVILGTDAAEKWIYFTASPDNATQLYLYRSRLDGRGRPERLTPGGQRGTHRYDIAPGGRFALHTCVRVRHAPGDGARAPARPSMSLRVARATTSALRGDARAALARPGGVLPGRRRRRRGARRLADEAARLRSGEEVSGAGLRLRRARRRRPCATPGAAPCTCGT